MHKQFMLLALEQAWLGRGVCAPNPSVGAVLVRDGKVIAQDWHRGPGTAHAEQRVVQNLSEKIDNLVLYVTLEPCNHWGRTPPCVNAIIDAGIRCVVFGFKDPNPIVSSQDTPTQLAQQGIDVIYYPLPEIDAFYQSYEHWMQHKKPFVTAKIAHSLDGKIADNSKQPVALSNQLCRAFTHKQRWHTDVILTTAETIRCDDPQFNARVDEKVSAKILAILDRNLALSDNVKVFSCAKECLIFHDEALTVAAPRAHCRYIPTPVQEEQLALAFIINTLGELGYHDVWVEAGGTLFSAMHQQHLVDKTYLYLAPIILGEGAVLAYHDKQFFNKPHKLTWQVAEDNIITQIEWLEY